MRHAIISLSLVCVLTMTAQVHAASAGKGKAAFVSHGCWQCHGYDGQGSVAGAKIAPDPIPLEAMSAFVRNTRGQMPPYGEAVLSDDDLADIHAYLRSIPKGRDAKDIPELVR
jgi:mono/diheme cytochrome c family protein